MVHFVWGAAPRASASMDEDSSLHLITSGLGANLRGHLDVPLQARELRL